MSKKMRPTIRSFAHPTSGICSETGAVMVEAAVVLPIFLAVMFITMNVALFCFRLLSFQYTISEITRQAFVSDVGARRGVAITQGDPSWRVFLESHLREYAARIGLKTTIPTSTGQGYTVGFWSAPSTLCSDWDCAARAKPGDIFTISVRLEEPIFSSALAGLSFQRISFETKAIAFVQLEESE